MMNFLTYSCIFPRPLRSTNSDELREGSQPKLTPLNNCNTGPSYRYSTLQRPTALFPTVSLLNYAIF